MKSHFLMGSVVYVAHPYGGDRENIKRVEWYLKEIQKENQNCALFSPLHNWAYEKYDMENPMPEMKRCLEILKKCDSLILCGDWRKSKGCLQEYAAALVLGKMTYSAESKNGELDLVMV